MKQATVATVELNKEVLVKFTADSIFIDDQTLFVRDENGILDAVYVLPPGSLTLFSKEDVE